MKGHARRSFARVYILTYHFYNTNLLSYITIPQDKGSKIKLKPTTTLYKVNTKHFDKKKKDLRLNINMIDISP